MHRHVMVEHNSQVSHTLQGQNAAITNSDGIDWHVHFNIGSRGCYHFRLFCRLVSDEDKDQQ